MKRLPMLRPVVWPSLLIAISSILISCSAQVSKSDSTSASSDFSFTIKITDGYTELSQDERLKKAMETVRESENKFFPYEKTFRSAGENAADLVPELLELAKDKNAKAIRALGIIRDRRALPVLMDLLDSIAKQPLRQSLDSPETKAIEALAKIGGSEAFAYLLTVPETRMNIPFALEDVAFDDPNAVLSALASENLETNETVFRNLNDTILGDPDLYPKILASEGLVSRVLEIMSNHVTRDRLDSGASNLLSHGAMIVAASSVADRGMQLQQLIDKTRGYPKASFATALGRVEFPESDRIAKDIFSVAPESIYVVNEIASRVGYPPALEKLQELVQKVKPEDQLRYLATLNNPSLKNSCIDVMSGELHAWGQGMAIEILADEIGFETLAILLDLAEKSANGEIPEISLEHVTTSKLCKLSAPPATYVLRENLFNLEHLHSDAAVASLKALQLFRDGTDDEVHALEQSDNKYIRTTAELVIAQRAGGPILDLILEGLVREKLERSGSVFANAVHPIPEITVEHYIELFNDSRIEVRRLAAHKIGDAIAKDYTAIEKVQPLFPEIIAALDSDVWMFINKRIVSSLGPDCIPSLIEKIDIENQNDFNLEAVLDILWLLTGRNFGSDVDAWRQWFEANAKAAKN